MFANFANKETKCIIFDQDGTLYPKDNPLALALRVRTKSWLMHKLNLSYEEVEELYQNLKIDFPNPFLGFQSIGASVLEYHEQVFNSIYPSDYLSYDHKLVSLLQKLAQIKYIVTFASPLYSEALQKCLGVMPFSEKTYYVNNFPDEFSKRRCYQTIAQSLRMTSSAICVVGDNFELDIIPAIELGCKAVHVSNEPILGAHETIPVIYELSSLFY